jgi:hypothetical protein
LLVMMQPRAVAVLLHDKKGRCVSRSLHRFQEDMHIKPFRDLVKKVYPTSETFIVNVREVTKPDPGAIRLRGQMWCPYCAAYRHYNPDTYLGINRCEVCGISDKDYHVQDMNGLWPKLDGVPTRKEKKKK